ncbi:MAG: CRISPR-associated protein [Muribaculaceae bacterium]|nr:CRISPR-associated protein [Muribaculaceae bacterium]
MERTIYNKRYLARVVIEAVTPLALGTGTKDVLTDALVARDLNGLPYIPGSSIAGVLRHGIGDYNDKNSIFGFQERNDGHGSRIMFTDAVLLDYNGEPQEGLITKKSPFLSRYIALPIRQHVRINHLGSTDKHGKFDEQIVYQGSRFVFEIEMVDNGENESRFRKVLDNISSQLFRLGGGTRCGFGAVRVIDMKYKFLDLGRIEDLELYISKSSSLRLSWEGFGSYTPNGCMEHSWHKYVLKLIPRDFFLFSSGFNDDEADTTPVTESFIEWDENDGQGRFVDDCILIPATSFKGALSHRVAYHWNKKNRFYAESGNGKVGNENEAVVRLFGSSGSESSAISRGNVLFSDFILKPTLTKQERASDHKLLNHVTIDRITGGTIDGHLFTEKVTHRSDLLYEVCVYVKAEALQDETVKYALERSMQDICDGLLPLGGGTNRGHGVFTGSIIKE